MRGVFLGLAILSLFACARRSAADPVDVVKLSLSGQVSCVGTPACGATVSSITGTYNFDPDTHSIVGSWSFATPLGVISSTNPTSSQYCLIASTEQCVFLEALGPEGVIELAFVFDENDFRGPFELGEESSLDGFFSCTPIQDGGEFCSLTDEFLFTSNPTISTITPEPSSFLLLGAGLLGLGPFIRRSAAS